MIPNCDYCRYIAVYSWDEPCRSCKKGGDNFELESKYIAITSWLGDFTPYVCEHCGKHTDSKTPYCAWCGRKATNYD